MGREAEQPTQQTGGTLKRGSHFGAGAFEFSAGGGGVADQVDPSAAELGQQLGSVLVAGAGLSMARNLDWETPLSLWQDTVEKQPRSALAHANLALACNTIGDRACALRELREAIALNPHRPDYRDALEGLERSPEAPALR